MKKIVLVLLLSCFLFCNNSFSVQYKDIVRVGISDNDFSRLYYQTATVSATKGFQVYDKKTGNSLFEGQENDSLKIDFGCGGISLSSKGFSKKNITTPIGVKPLKDGLLKVVGLQRKGLDALYKGEFELSIYNNSKGFNIINVVDMEDYLQGVVPNEMPVSFGLEALKAQSIAARNYTLRPREKKYHNFDVCDTVDSQVYFGANATNPISNKAIEATNGLFGLYNGELILALYCSTAGGYTENYENVFLRPCCSREDARAIPYLIGKPDYKSYAFSPYSSEEEIEEFYKASPDSFDKNSRYYRWDVHWTKAELTDILRENLKKYAKSGFIYPVFEEADFGELLGVSVVSRGVSGKAISLCIQTDRECFEVKKELIIRKIFTKNNKMLNSANIVIKNICDEYNDLVGVHIYGGGLGHGVGMSQYGASFMASNGAKFDEILRHYYTNIAIGTYPFWTSKKESVAIDFASPIKKGVLRFENPDLADGLNLVVNGQKISLDADFLMNNESYSLDKYIKAQNHIEFLPSNEKIKVWVEVYKQNEN